MKKTLPLIALLATAAFSMPTMAETAKEIHKEIHQEKKEIHQEKKEIRHERHMHHKAMKHGHKVEAMEMRHDIHQDQRDIAQEHREIRHERAHMPSMRHGFQK